MIIKDLTTKVNHFDGENQKQLLNLAVDNEILKEEKEKQVDWLRGKNEEISHIAEEKENKMTHQKAEIEVLNRQQVKLDGQVDTQSSTIIELNTKIRDKIKEIKELTSELNQWQLKQENWKNEKSGLIEQINKHKKEIFNYLRKKHSVEAHSNALTNRLNGVLMPLGFTSIRNMIQIEGFKKPQLKTETQSTAVSSKTYRTVAIQTSEHSRMPLKATSYSPVKAMQFNLDKRKLSTRKLDHQNAQLNKALTSMPPKVAVLLQTTAFTFPP